jgi:hypothetical protein
VVIGLAGIVAVAREMFGWKVLPIYLVAYLGIVLVWPWPPFRFIAPVLPYLLAYSLNIVTAVIRKGPGALKHAGVVLLCILLIVNAAAIFKDIEMTKANHYPAYMMSWGSESVKWSAYEEMFDWIKGHSNPDEAFVSGMDPMLFLYTGRRSFRPYVSRPSSMFYQDPTPAYGELSEVMETIKSYKAHYLVLSPMPGFSDELPYAQFVVESQKKYPGWLERVYHGKDKRFVIWRISGAVSSNF